MNHQWRDNANKMVRWQDGTFDFRRGCDECTEDACKAPVHEDRYREVGHVNWETQDADVAAMGYWTWMHSHHPLGMSRDNDGEAVVQEFDWANPDCLPEGISRGSGVTEQQYMWLQEAYEQLTGPQKEVWGAVMREQTSQADFSRKHDISEAAVTKRLQGAKTSVANYLRSKQEDAVFKERMS